MPRFFFPAALFLAAGLTLSAQAPSPNAGAPFTAIETSTSTIAGKVTVRTATIARRSDGSGYWRRLSTTIDGVPQPNGPRSRAEIYDTGKRLLTEIDLSAGVYQTTHQVRRPRALGPALLARGEFVNDTPAAGALHSPFEWHIVDLGVRKIEGVDAVGTLQNKVDGGSFEEWSSPRLFLVLRSSSHTSSPLADSFTTISDLRLGEPDPALFQVPAGFTALPARK